MTDPLLDAAVLQELCDTAGRDFVVELVKACRGYTRVSIVCVSNPVRMNTNNLLNHHA